MSKTYENVASVATLAALRRPGRLFMQSSTSVVLGIVASAACPQGVCVLKLQDEESSSMASHF